jgi:hypothetical protein
MQVNLSRAEYYLEAFILPDYKIREKYRLKHSMCLCKHGPTPPPLLQENVCQVTWRVEYTLLMGRGRFWDFDNFFEQLAERLAHALGGFGGCLNKQTFVLSSDSCAFGFGDLSQVGL